MGRGFLPPPAAAGPRRSAGEWRAEVTLAPDAHLPRAGALAQVPGSAGSGVGQSGERPAPARQPGRINPENDIAKSIVRPNRVYSRQAATRAVFRTDRFCNWPGGPSPQGRCALRATAAILSSERIRVQGDNHRGLIIPFGQRALRPPASMPRQPCPLS